MSGAMTPHVGALFAAIPDKVLARAAGVHRNTAGRWKRAESMPGADDLMRLMASSDEVFLEVLRHIGREPDTSAARQHLERALAALEGRE
jgi:transcriptional regulator with XRE-family HTH domain